MDFFETEGSNRVAKELYENGKKATAFEMVRYLLFFRNS